MTIHLNFTIINKFRKCDLTKTDDLSRLIESIISTMREKLKNTYLARLKMGGKRKEQFFFSNNTRVTKCIPKFRF